MKMVIMKKRKYINNRIVGDGIFYHTNGYKIIKHDGKDELEKKVRDFSNIFNKKNRRFRKSNFIN